MSAPGSDLSGQTAMNNDLHTRTCKPLCLSEIYAFKQRPRNTILARLEYLHSDIVMTWVTCQR